ncbi:MAG: flagellar biosynthesis protein FlhA [Bdellovibrionota bacterium]
MEGLFQFIKKFDGITKNTDLLMAFGLIAVIIFMIIPLPPFLLDVALTMSLALSLLILLSALYATKALDFSVFPSLLLVATLFRLSLNIATTRLVLSHGHEGTAAAGHVVEAFGGFVVGDNYIIGLILFLILIVINFVVITKGSGRVAEVAARFTLDAMPGKQMSIDADLNAGLINEEEARRRRKEIEAEADFYGSMDGASKFVRGDAIAGIVITGINILGGLLIGVLQKGLDISTAAEYYTKLTIGDGLVSQIPALIISTAAGTIVTRSSSGKNMGTEMAKQLFLKPRAVNIASVVMILLGLIPGFPFFPFAIMSAGTALIAWFMTKLEAEKAQEEITKAQDAAAKPKENVEGLLALDTLELEVGYGLISVVESSNSGDLLERIVSIRKQFALDLGIVVPSIHIRDNLQLNPGEYRILIKGATVGKGILQTDSLLAMDPGNVLRGVDGTPTKEPAFGLDALWISEATRDEAELAGYTVVDLPTVIATHLTEVVRTNAHELIGRQEVTKLVDGIKKTHPKVVEELIPEHMSIGSLVQVLKGLLKEQVSIRDLLTIMETLGDESQKTKDIEMLVEGTRKRLSRSITRKYTNDEGIIPVLSLSPMVEETITNSLLQTENGIQLVMDPHTANKLIMELSRQIERNPDIASSPILLTSPTIRRHIHKLTSRFIPQLVVLSHNELTSDAQVSSVGTVEIANAG